MISNLLIFGSQQKIHLSLEADWAADLVKGLQRLKEPQYEVAVVPLVDALENKFLQAWPKLLVDKPWLQLVIIAPTHSRIQDLSILLSEIHAFRVLDQLDSPELHGELVAALEQARKKKQEIELEHLVAEQSQKLMSIYQDLEERIDKRQRSLLESRRKSHLSEKRWELIREAILTVHQALSLPELEKSLLEVLRVSLQIKNLRILFKPQDNAFVEQTRKQSHLVMYQAALFQLEEKIGSLFFLRDEEFSKDEIELFQKVAESVSLALNRLSKLEQSESLKEQWQTTFNAITAPAALIAENYDVIQANSAFLERLPVGASSSPAGMKCYKTLFARETPCPNCRLGKNFRLEMGRGKSQSWEIYSQEVKIEPLHERAYFHIYQDITDQLKMERKILESARMAELGTIGSSIAHELNNPLGGILSFVQLIKMDLKPEDTLYPDIEEMENGVRRCKDIVQNLLGFTRDPLADQESEFDLKDVILRAQKIVELQTRSRGIEIKLQLSPRPAPFRGHLNLLSQAIRNLLQMSIDSIKEKAHNQKGFHGVIEIHLTVQEMDYQIMVLDNGQSSGQTSHLSFSVASQIVRDYGGRLEIQSAPKQMTLAKISLPRPVLPIS